MGMARVTGKRKLTQRQREIEESKSASNGSNARDGHIEPDNNKMGRTTATKKKKLTHTFKKTEESESAPKSSNARDEHIEFGNSVRHEDINPQASKNIAVPTVVKLQKKVVRTANNSQAAEDNAIQAVKEIGAAKDKNLVKARAAKKQLAHREKEADESKSAPSGSNAGDGHTVPNNDKIGRTRAIKKKKLAQIQKEIEESESVPKWSNARDEDIESDNNVRYEDNPQASKNIALQTVEIFGNKGARTEGNSQAAEDIARQTEGKFDAMDNKMGKARAMMKKKKLTLKHEEIGESKSAVKASNAKAKHIEPDNDVRNEDNVCASKNSASLTVKRGRISDMKKKLGRKQKEIEEPKFAPKGSNSMDGHIEIDVPNEGNPQRSKNNATQMIINFENSGARTKDNPQAFEDITMQTEGQYEAVMDKKRGRGRAKEKKQHLPHRKKEIDEMKSTPKVSNVRHEHIVPVDNVRNEDNPRAFEYGASQTEGNSENNNGQIEYDPQSFDDNVVQTEEREIEELIQDEEKNPIKKRKSRGPTRVERLFFDLASRIKVEFNEEGVPIGEGSVKLSSYLGPLVRKHVPITLNNWKRVSDELKAVLWESIQAKFKLDMEWQKKVIFQQMGCIWRASKSRLVRKIIKAKTNEERFKLKPDNVESMEWDKFIESKTSLNFMKRSEIYRAMRSNQVPHTCGRKGMARLAEDLKEESIDPSSVSRVQVWIKSRTLKSGKPVSMTVADTIEKIKKIENESEYNLAIEDKENALSQLLGQDRLGRPRAMVRGKTLTSVTSSHAQDKQIAQFQSKISELEGMVRMLIKKQGKKSLEEKSIPQLSKCDLISDKCDLLDWSGTDEIVAEGRVVSGDPNELVHKVPLGPNAMKILILVSKKSDVFLWRPTPNLTYIGDAEDHIVAWPANRVVLRAGETSSTEKKCKLYDWSGSKELIAEGRLCSSDPKQLVNDIPLGPSAVAVWVDDPIKQDAFLWRPTSGTTFVGEAVGKKVAWPKSNVAIENFNVVASPTPTVAGAISHATTEKQDAWRPTSGTVNFGEDVSRKVPWPKSNVLMEQFNTVASSTPAVNARVPPMTANIMAKNKCKLTDLSGTGEIVAEGRVLSTDPRALVHFVPLGRNAVKVMVDFVKVPNAVLWRPSSELEYIKDTIGTTVAWPAANVIME